MQITKIGLRNSGSDTSILKLEYGYGNNTQNNGNLRTQKISFNGLSQPFEQTYSYDSLNRLQSAEEKVNNSTTWKQTFQYDRFGNRRFDANNTTTLGSCSQAICNPLINTSDNRISANQGYNFDANGNLTQDANGKQFLYDAENHQKEVKDSANVTIGLYVYDGEGKRIKKISSTETVIFVYDGGGQLVAEYSTQTVTTPQVSYLTVDHLGSARVITDQNGKVTTRKDYLAFGDEASSAQRAANPNYDSSETRKGYTGYEKDDESGLEFAQARYYNATHGRFTSVDPLTASANVKNPQTFNRYSYVLNSPYKFTDPLGLLSVTTSACGQWCSNSYQGEGRYIGSNGNFPTEQHAEGPAPPPVQMAEQNAETSHSTLKPGSIKITSVEIFNKVPVAGRELSPGYVTPGTEPINTTTPDEDDKVNITAPSGVFYITVTATMDGDAKFTPLEMPTITPSSIGNAFEQTTFPGEKRVEGETIKPRVEYSEDGKTLKATFAVKRREDSNGKSTTFTVGFSGRSTQGAAETLFVNEASDPRGKVIIKIGNSGL